MKLAIQINEKDNVATITSAIEFGEKVSILSATGKKLMKVVVKEKVPPFHKIALENIEKSEKVIKYGEKIGIASSPIEKGEWVHVHNLESFNLPTMKVKGGGCLK